MSGTDAFINSIQGVMCVAYFILAARLWRLGQRSGQNPERLLGLTFLLWGISYIVYYPPYYLLVEGPLQSSFFFCSGFLDSAGAFMLALVTQSVFRRRERWARWLVGGIGFCLITGAIGSAWVGDLAGISVLSNPWYWFEVSGDTAAVIWIAIEGLQQYRKARQRRSLGLCDPIVCNRYLLWGLSGVSWIVYNAAVIAEYVDYSINQRWSDSLDLLVNGLSVIAVGLIWLVFFPPARYRRWIQNADAAATAAEG